MKKYSKYKIIGKFNEKGISYIFNFVGYLEDMFEYIKDTLKEFPIIELKYIS